MTNTILNIFLSVINIIIGIYFVYSTYKKPAPLISTDLKGYFGGIGFIIIGLMSLFGKLNLLEIFKEIFDVLFNKR